MTIGSVAVYRARAMLDAQAEFYVARQVEAPFDARYAGAREAPQPPAVANLAVEVRPDPKPAQPASTIGAAEPAPATNPAPPAAPAAAPDLHDATRNDEDADVTGAIAGKGGVARFSTVYVHRGAEPPAAYVVPRE